jgi:hypothetical protein
MRLVLIPAVLFMTARAAAQDGAATPNLPPGLTAPERVGRYARLSLYYVYAVGRPLVKARGTVPQADWEQTDIPQSAREFARRAIGGAAAAP